MTKLFVKITRDTLPQVKDKYPFIYLEHGRLEIDDSSLKWIDAEGQVIRLPAATINTILLGPGTSLTHAAVKTAAAANCAICWVGEDSLLFYAAGFLPTATTQNLQRQIKLAAQRSSALEIARKLFKKRFPAEDMNSKTLKSMMGMEGHRVRQLYEEKAIEYGVGWKGRQFTPGKFNLSDTTNKIMTSANAALYGILCSAIHAMGYSPHIGFIHSGSPMPFVYDMADLYKTELTIDLAFHLTREMAGHYDKQWVAEAFRQRAIDIDLLSRISRDIQELFNTGQQDAHCSSE